MTMNQSQISITESTASIGLTEMRQDYKDVTCKRILFDVYEAVTHERVSVKLLVDFERFLSLQRKLPSEYADKRLAVTLPLERFDDYMDEAVILERVIRSRRLAGAAPLICEFCRRDKDS